MLTGPALLPLWVLLLFSPASADLETELYREAVQSLRLRSLRADLGELTEFIGSNASQTHVAVLLHDANCPHCRKALPELDRVAAELKGQLIVIAHVDCTANKAAFKEPLGLRGFPALLFWRRRAEGGEDLVGRDLVVSSDAGFVLRASRLAGIAVDRDPSRLALLGQTVTVRRADPKDLTVQVEGPGRLFVWFPEEVLQTPGGQQVPYRRAEAMAKYQGVWEKDTMLRFMKHMMEPVVVPLLSQSQLSSSMKEDIHRGLVFCGPEMTAGFHEVAATHQLNSKVFHASDPADCPVQAQPGQEGPRLVVYSPATLQWSAKPGAAKAAVAVAAAEVVAKDTQLVFWAARNLYPGITWLGYTNFQVWLRGNRSAVLVAVNVANLKENEAVEARLREVGRPRPAGEGLEEYTYGSADRYLGVTDGTLEGLSHFGVRAKELPRAVVFEGPDAWVEDERELTVQNLSNDLLKVPMLWRMSDDVRGYILWTARRLGRLYVDLDRAANSAAGYGGRCALVFLAAVSLWLSVRIAYSLASFVVLTLLSMVQGDEEAAAAEKSESKKRK